MSKCGEDRAQELSTDYPKRLMQSLYLLRRFGFMVVMAVKMVVVVMGSSSAVVFLRFLLVLFLVFAFLHLGFRHQALECHVITLFVGISLRL